MTDYLNKIVTCRICGKQFKNGEMIACSDLCKTCHTKTYKPSQTSSSDTSSSTSSSSSSEYHPTWSGYAGNGCGGFRETHNKF